MHDEYQDRIRLRLLRERVTSAATAAEWIHDGMTVGMSGFTRAGDAKVVPLAPRERAQVIINNCVPQPYRQMLNDYVAEANQRGGHTPHVLEQALSWHIRFRDTGSMLPLKENPLALEEALSCIEVG